MKSSPAFMFYPGDWLRDPALRACSLEGRGLWIDMLAHMHEGDPYGHFRFGGRDFPPDQLPAKIARMMGIDLRKARRLLGELEAAGVFSRTETGTIYSRRLVRDQETRMKRAQGGTQSLKNPNVPRPKTIMEGYPSTHPSDHPSPDPSASPLPPSFEPSLGVSLSSSSSISSSKDSPPSPQGEGLADSAGGNGAAPKPEELVRTWNSIPGVKPVQNLMPGKGVHRRILLRLKEQPDHAWWERLFETVKASDWLCGRTNGRSGPFHVTLEWALGPENLAKILQGDYANTYARRVNKVAL